MCLAVIMWALSHSLKIKQEEKTIISLNASDEVPLIKYDISPLNNNNNKLTKTCN